MVRGVFGEGVALTVYIFYTLSLGANAPSLGETGNMVPAYLPRQLRDWRASRAIVVVMHAFASSAEATL
jgi:hypothetical protein